MLQHESSTTVQWTKIQHFALAYTRHNLGFQ